MAQAAQVILSENDFAKRENVNPRTVMRWRTTGDGPPFIRLGLRRIGYRLEDIEAWEAQRTFPHRAAELSRKLQGNQDSAARSRRLEAAQSA